MGCKECGKSKCNGKCGCNSPKVLQINNPPEYITFHKVSVPAVMGDSKTNPPAIGKYKNVLLYYEADQTSWLYSTDGIPTKLTNGITNYEDAINLPQINGHTLLGNQSSSDLGLQGELTAGANIQINNNVISATDTTYTAGDGIEINSDNEISVKIGRGLEFNSDGEIDVSEEYIIGFDTVALMKNADNLIDGSYARTLGFYTKNDGGGALYKIRKVTNDDTVDEAFLVEIGDPENELVAELIIENNTVSIKQLGGRSQKTDGTKYDIKNYIYKYITYIASQSNRCRLYIPAGIWTTTAINITNTKGFDIYGDFGYSEYKFDSTIITTMGDNQSHVLNLGTNEGTYLKNFNLQNIIFSTFDWSYDSTTNEWQPSTAKKVTNQVMNMLYCIHGKLDNIMFNHCVGQCLKISACWENIYSYLTFRFVSNPTSSILCFGADQTYGQYASVSSSDFQKMYFEKCHGDCIEVKSHASVTNNHFGVINLEPNQFNYDSTFTYTTLDASDLPAGMKHYYIIKLSESGSNMAANKIESIELNGMANRVISFDSNDYAYDSILFTGDGYQYFNNVIGSIVSTSTHKDIVLYKNTSTNLFNSGDSALIIQSVLIDSNFDYVFDVTNAFPVIKVGGEMKGKGAVTKVASNLVTFQECIQSCASNGAMNNCITSDDGAINETKLCFRPHSYINKIVGGTIVSAISKIYVHAKVDNGETFKINLCNEDDSHGQELSFAGDGTWKWYEFDLNENMAVMGQKCWFKTQNASNKNVLLDTFCFA